MWLSNQARRRDGPETIRQCDPRSGYLRNREAIEAAVLRVLDSGDYILGTEVAAFEREFSALVPGKEVVGVGSGTGALQIALLTVGVGPGDLVATVSHTANATLAAIFQTGARPILVDIDADSFTMSPRALEECLDDIGPKPIRAVVPVHLYGHPADMPAIASICAEHDVVIVEDCAQAHGADIGGTPVGCWGEAAAFSFYPTKNLGCFGDGGAVVASPERAERARGLRQYGWKTRFVSEEPGLNSRLDEIQAAVLRVKLAGLREENHRRRNIAALYSSLLEQDLSLRPPANAKVTHVYHQYVVTTAARNELKAHLDDLRIQTAIHYPVPTHRQPAYRNALVGPAGLNVTEAVCEQILSLPMYPELTYPEVEEVCARINAWQRKVFAG